MAKIHQFFFEFLSKIFLLFRRALYFVNICRTLIETIISNNFPLRVYSFSQLQSHFYHVLFVPMSDYKSRARLNICFPIPYSTYAVMGHEYFKKIKSRLHKNKIFSPSTSHTY